MRLLPLAVGRRCGMSRFRACNRLVYLLRRRPSALALITAGALLAGASLGVFSGAGLPARAQEPAQADSAALIAAQNAYIIGPGDQLQLTLLDPGVSNLSGSFEILNDGSASLALLGSVVLEGLTVNQATSWLQSLYGRYLLRPDLNLRVARPRPVQVSLVGEVESPGLYALSASASDLPTVVTAIQKAGGLTLNADLTNVRLQRRLPGDIQQLRETEVNLAALLQLGDKYQNPYLFDGDTIVVGKAITPDREVMELAATNLTPQTIQVNVVGEVMNPGRIELQANTPLVQAILAAGGPQTWRANRSNVELVRLNRNGTATREVFSINYSKGVSRASNPPLRNGDTVIVNRSTYAVVTDALDAVTQPLSTLVNAWALFDVIRYNNTN